MDNSHERDSHLQRHSENGESPEESLEEAPGEGRPTAQGRAL
jgi:hypothetical protein